MIETAKGMKNLKNILESDTSMKLFKYIHYGHFDYALDSGLWPSRPKSPKILGYCLKYI